MSNTKQEIEPEVVALSRTGTAEKTIRLQSAHSFRRTSNDGGSAETTDKGHEGGDIEVGANPGEEGVAYTSQMPDQRRDFFRRHWLVTTVAVVAIIVAAFVIGFLVIRSIVIRNGHKTDLVAAGQYVTTTDPSGGLHTTFVPNEIASFLSTYYAHPTPTPTPTPTPSS